MDLSWLSFRSNLLIYVVARARSSRGQLARGTESVTTRLPLLSKRLRALDQEIRERRQLEQVRPPFFGSIAEHLEALPGQITELLILRDVKPPRLRGCEVGPDAVHPLPGRSRALDGM